MVRRHQRNRQWPAVACLAIGALREGPHTLSAAPQRVVLTRHREELTQHRVCTSTIVEIHPAPSRGRRGSAKAMQPMPSVAAASRAWVERKYGVGQRSRPASAQQKVDTRNDGGGEARPAKSFARFLQPSAAFLALAKRKRAYVGPAVLASTYGTLHLVVLIDPCELSRNHCSGNSRDRATRSVHALPC